MEGCEKQKNLQFLVNRNLEQLSSTHTQADRLILDTWNQVEAKYQEVPPNEKRSKKYRDYDLIYYYRTGEKTNGEVLQNMLVDSYSHLFLEEFAEDLPLVAERARAADVTHIFMPSIGNTTIEPILSVCDTYRGFCFPMIGLCLASVNDSYEKKLGIAANRLVASERFVIVGEIGTDLYWDKTWLKEQLIVFGEQVQRALQYQLPIVIYCHRAFDYVYKVLQPYESNSLAGIFHSFTEISEGTARMMKFSGFKIGINDMITFKKPTLPEALEYIPLERIMPGTDSPYLTPASNHGKRDESANVKDTLVKVVKIYKGNPEKVVELTTISALKVFGILR